MNKARPACLLVTVKCPACGSAATVAVTPGYMKIAACEHCRAERKDRAA